MFLRKRIGENRRKCLMHAKMEPFKNLVLHVFTEDESCFQIVWLDYSTKSSKINLIY